MIQRIISIQNSSQNTASSVQPNARSNAEGSSR
jgi:hypothetical protein